MPKLFILGCGFVGSRVGGEMVLDGWRVCGSTRSDVRAKNLRAAGIEPLLASLDDDDRLRSAIGEADALLVAIAAGRGGSYEDTYVRTAELVRAATVSGDANAPRRIIYTSSTRVYEESNGGWVDEDAPAGGSDENGKALARAESVFLECAGPGRFVSVLRLGGIYGAERDMRARVLAANDAPGDGNTWVNLIHVDDITRTMAKLFAADHSGVLNLTDGQPVVRRSLYDAIRQAAEADALVWSGAAGALAGKRVRSDRIFDLLGIAKPAGVWERLELAPPAGA